MRRVSEFIKSTWCGFDHVTMVPRPSEISGGQRLTGCHTNMQVASAQVKSALLLAGLYADGETSVTEASTYTGSHQSGCCRDLDIL